MFYKSIAQSLYATKIETHRGMLSTFPYHPSFNSRFISRPIIYCTLFAQLSYELD